MYMYVCVYTPIKKIKKEEWRKKTAIEMKMIGSIKVCVFWFYQLWKKIKKNTWRYTIKTYLSQNFNLSGQG